MEANEIFSKHCSTLGFQRKGRNTKIMCQFSSNIVLFNTEGDIVLD